MKRPRRTCRPSTFRGKPNRRHRALNRIRCRNLKREIAHSLRSLEGDGLIVLPDATYELVVRGNLIEIDVSVPLHTISGTVRQT